MYAQESPEYPRPLQGALAELPQLHLASRTKEGSVKELPSDEQASCSDSRLTPHHRILIHLRLESSVLRTNDLIRQHEVGQTAS